ncbi:MAG TPA: NADH-quinone oxidoreductase subunit NuoH [Anaerolineaceae bacterium]|nr:NADH-quinone oxidoreductase subunit NuoH [Anaerolineaceae bacterium]
MSFWRDPINFLASLLQNWLSGLGLAPGLVQLISFVVGSAVLATGSLLFVIFLIWLERKLFGRVQDRLGPNRVGPYGLFQPFADMAKIFTKEYVTPTGADKVPYNLAPILMVAAVIMIWAVIPFASTIYGVDLNVGVLYIVAVGGLAELAIVLAGWGSNNKYALLGGLRAVAMLVSYEVPMILSLLIPVLLSGSLSLNGVVVGQNIWFIFMAPLAAFIFFITSMAEISRAPFDIAEAESEIVAGFNIEYSGLKFGFFYVGEFLHGFTAALLFTVLFLGGWRGPFAESIPILGFVYFVIKASLVYLFIVLVDASLPRFRIDQLMDLSWKVLTPLALALIALVTLADKILLELGVTNLWIRLPVFLAINAALALAANWFLNRPSQKERPIVSDRPRPVARPNNFNTLPD